MCNTRLPFENAMTRYYKVRLEPTPFVRFFFKNFTPATIGWDTGLDSSSMAKDKADISLDQVSIMVIEDNDYMLDILINSLRNMGFKRLQKLQSGKEAVEYLKLTARDFGAAVEPIDIVVSDLVMAPISGLHLFNDKGTPSRLMPFTMLSGDADRASVEQ